MTDISLPGVITMGFHFIESMDALVSLVVDPVAKTPEMKICAVRATLETRYHLFDGHEGVYCIKIEKNRTGIRAIFSNY